MVMFSRNFEQIKARITEEDIIRNGSPGMCETIPLSMLITSPSELLLEKEVLKLREEFLPRKTSVLLLLEARPGSGLTMSIPNRCHIRPKAAGPRPLHRPLTPIRVPCTAP